MSDAYIVRRGGGGGEGFDPNGAVLKVVTSTGCAIAVTNVTAGYSKTHQQADGYPRSNNADMTEHFFSIPAGAFGTLTVVATNTYGNNTKTVTVNTAGKVYEVLLSAPNILLNSEFGKQDSFVFQAPTGTFAIYDSDYKIYTLKADGSVADFLTSKSYDVSLYSKIRVTYRQSITSSRLLYLIYFIDKDGERFDSEWLSNSSSYVTESITLRNKEKTPFTFDIRKSDVVNVNLIFSEIVLE